ncbi:hypothetical protein Q787_07885 [Ornithobacterium rhinotracheale H06-030791]|nr:hypothetical protein Q785_08055 [Ornithobacterium rhinotracheale ORT-UMN 88]KGB66420.1 hypothetical protein Q787_07885 [Ornithobacterium rhinotracheale H06-030791]
MKNIFNLLFFQINDEQIFSSKIFTPQCKKPQNYKTFKELQD